LRPTPLATPTQAGKGEYEEAKFVMTDSTYPVKVNAQLDTKLSRGLWLVKWLLAIPHYVI
jgi:hypothetical protein